MQHPTEKAAGIHADPAHPRPRSLWALFMAFTLLALQGFGGVLAVVQHDLVERKRWLTREEFVEEWAVAQVMPGPNVVNLSLMLGHRYFGWRGAVVALSGMLLVPSMVVLGLALLYAQHAGQAEVTAALRGMGAVAAGLIAAAGLKLLSTLRTHPLGLPLCAFFACLVFAAVVWLRAPLVAVLFTVGTISCVLTWRKLRP